MIRIEISESELVDGKWTPTTASVLGFASKSDAPVLDLCRQLAAAGHDRAEPAEAYRGATLALHIRSIGEAAGLRVTTNATGRPVFAPLRPQQQAAACDESEEPLPA